MSDLDLPIEGQDVSVTVTVGGVIQLVQDQITSFTRKSMSDEGITKNLGTDGSRIRMVFSHWEGTCEFAESRKTLDDINDAVMLARRQNLPIEIEIVEKVKYRNGTNATHTYINIVWGDVESTAVRSEARKTSVPWKSGSHRLTS